MHFDLLETVVLMRDMPEFKLKRGDLGTIVELYETDGLEVEFVTAAGRTQAVVTLHVNDVRKVEANDLIAVRSLQPA